jgi:N-acetylmannosamine-6-phosphate 2-epimerase / N-acetylmannosamine kinase
VTLSGFLDVLLDRPLVASVQADEDTPLAHPEMLARLARAGADAGVGILRAQGVDNIRAIRQATGLPTIGLIKRKVPGSDVFITATAREVDELLGTETEVVALDGTDRDRGNDPLEALIERVHRGGRLAMADCDTLDAVEHAVACGADLVGTTLSGYTPGSHPFEGPDLEFVRRAAAAFGIPVLAEGRYQEPWQVQAALRAGAAGVVVGGALNDPIKQTRRFLEAARPVRAKVGAVDIGGTWIRFGVFDGEWRLGHVERFSLPQAREDRIEWIRERVRESGVERLGVSTGGVVDPATGEVWDAKPIVPEHVGSVFHAETLGVPVMALNDGLATAWGHACLPLWAGKRVATLALGTGVGCGFVAEGRIWMGPRGEYPRLNDLPSADGDRYERLLGGAALTEEPSLEDQARAAKAFLQAALTLQEMLFPDQIVVCGGVGLSPWLRPWLGSPGLSASPFGEDAGLYGAAALAFFPHWR